MMYTMNRAKWMGVLLLFIGHAGTSVLAQSSTELGVTGFTNADGSYQLQVTPADFDIDAILVYAQPSQTLLVAVLDTAYKVSQEGQTLFSNVDGRAKALVEGDLSQIAPIVLLPEGPPVTDLNIQVLVYGSFAGTQLKGMEIINAKVSTGGTGSSHSYGLWAQLQVVNGVVVSNTCCRCGVDRRDCGRVSNCRTPICNCINCTMTCG